MLDEYRQHVEERASQGIAPEPLNPEQTAALIELLKKPPTNEEDFILAESLIKAQKTSTIKIEVPPYQKICN